MDLIRLDAVFLFLSAAGMAWAISKKYYAPSDFPWMD